MNVGKELEHSYRISHAVSIASKLSEARGQMGIDVSILGSSSVSIWKSGIRRSLETTSANFKGFQV